MIGFASLLAGVVLLLLLVALAAKGWLAARDSREARIAQDDNAGAEMCPPELVGQVFSRQDSEFIRGMRAPELVALFQQERKRVALVWVGQTSAMIQRVMREHAEAARQSKSVDFPTELKIWRQFLSLVLICGTLSVMIQVAGPLWLASLARVAQRLSEQMTNVQSAFRPAPPVSADAAGSE